MTLRTPTTAAGRALLRYAQGLPNPFITPTWLVGILDIEAEARAPLDVDRLWTVLGSIGVIDSGTCVGFSRADAERIAREYAALEEPTDG